MTFFAALLIVGCLLMLFQFGLKYKKARRTSAQQKNRDSIFVKRAFALALGTPERVYSNLPVEPDCDGHLYYFLSGSDASKRQMALRYLSIYKDHPVFQQLELIPLDKSPDDAGKSTYKQLFEETDPNETWQEGRNHALGILNALFTKHNIGVWRGQKLENSLAGTSTLIVELTRLYAQAGLISNEEAWGLLYLNAERSRVTFNGWDDYLGAWSANLTDLVEDDSTNEIKNKLKKTSVTADKILVGKPWPATNIFADFQIVANRKSVPQMKRSA